MSGDEEWGLVDTRPSDEEGRALTPSHHQPGEVIGRRWRLEKFLDGGGMGTVWRATDLRLDEPAAVKLLNPYLLGTSDARARFKREARAAARLRGANVVSVLDCDIDEATGAPYIAMELLEGEDLARRLARGPLGYLQTRSVLRDVGRAVGRAHRAQIVHRDLKPGNIYLATTDEGTLAKVLDFGIAKLLSETGGPVLTAPGRTLGTPHYMSPEQISDPATVDHRSDLWALAVIAYECLVGHKAFPGASSIQVLHRICLSAPVPASELGEVPEGFDEWFLRATRIDRDARFASADELVGAFLALGPAPAGMGREGASPARPRIRAHRSRAWVSDANQVDIETIEEVVFENSVVEDFVHDDRRHFVSGAKGCGKTLLLTYKRARLGARYLDDKRGEGARKVTFIPEGRPYLDLMSDLRTVGRSAMDFMESLANAKRLWGFALRMAVISHHPEALGPARDSATPRGRLPAGTLAVLPARLRALAEGQKAEPTVVAKEVLALSVSQAHQLLDQVEMALEHAIRSTHHGVFIFIDKIDQALRGLSRDAWISMQAGLVEAAWDLMNANAHVKVFASIREEAFSAYESDIKTNLFGATTSIRYSKEDLRRMLERLTAFYEGLPLADFVTLDVVSTGAGNRTESAFDYLYRHTLGRPRDFVIVASEISRRRSDLDERAYKSIVQETCADILVANVFDEMRVFLEVLGERESRLRFLAALPFAVLSRDDLVDVWCRYHGLGADAFPLYHGGEGGPSASEAFHPFRELYECGLLGLVADDPVTETRRQVFKQPHQPMDACRFDLPRSEVYLLHPSLHALLRRLGIQEGFRMARDIVIGHDLEWGPEHALLARVQRELYRGAERFESGVERGVRDLLSELARRVARGERFEAVRASLAEGQAFERLTNDLERLGWDDLYLLLLEAFSPSSAPTREL